VDNAGEAKIRHLLEHTSGIRNTDTRKLVMNINNRKHNDWSKEDVLGYVYGKKAEFELDKYYGYSNTNYLLLGMILEQVSGQTLKEVYEQRIFNPLGLKSAHYGTGDDKAPGGVVKGYNDFLGQGEYVESDAFYMDVLGVGGAGGIAINAQDLGMFMMQLVAGKVVSESSLARMQDWFEKPWALNPDKTNISG
jgi:D-alanyl-D-alanine carboxypeptidase